MRFASVCIIVLALTSPGSTALKRLQDKPEPAPAEAGATAYPDTADGLRQLLQDVLAAAKSGDKERVAAFLRDMEVPNYQEWFYKTYAADSAESWVGPYGANLARNERSMQELFERLAREKDGELSTRSVNDSPQPGKGLAWGMLQAQKQPVDIYFASWKRPDDPTTSKSEPIGYFLFIEGKFRWDSLISFVRPRKAPDSAPPVSQSANHASPEPGVDPSHNPQRVRVSGGLAQSMVVSKVPPVYPQEARDKGVQGQVKMLAVISKAGEVQQLTLIEGDPLLAPAAMDAVRQWKYRPYLLNGNPVEVETTINVVFTLRGK